MCSGGGGSPSAPPPPPPPPPVDAAELKVGATDDTPTKRKRRGMAKLTIPINKSPNAGLSIPKAT